MDLHFFHKDICVGRSLCENTNEVSKDEALRKMYGPKMHTVNTLADYTTRNLMICMHYILFRTVKFWRVQ